MKKVVLGISGGVDSSVAAILLKKQGYEVIGVTFVFTDDFNTEEAKKVCEKLQIKHYIKDYRQNFKDNVINKFINDYKSGLTPNPCVHCNKTTKLKYLFDIMNELDADFVATGHYARIVDGHLFKSENKDKDQSYFLAQLNSDQLSKILFPLNSLTKEEVRAIAKKYDLVNAGKKDSFDVCFITTNFKDYIAKNIKNTPGSIVNINSGLEVGKHEGLSYHTIGQRKGLNLGGNQLRNFVVGKNLEENILYVADEDQQEYLYSDSALIVDVNWIGEKKNIKCMAKFRYRQQDNPVEVEHLPDGNILVRYPQGIKSITPGQTCVFYDEDKCLGGGTIKEVFKNNKKLWYL